MLSLGNPVRRISEVGRSGMAPENDNSVSKRKGRAQLNAHALFGLSDCSGY